MSFTSAVEKVDQTTIQKCEKFAHWFQKLTSKTNYFIAKVGISLFIFSLTLRVLNYFFPSMFETKTSLMMALVCSICIIWSVVQLILLEKADRLVNSNSEDITKPAFLGNAGIYLRVYCLIGFILMFTISAVITLISKKGELLIYDAYVLTILDLGFVTYVYFIEVNPLRPNKSKLKRFVSKYSFGFLKPVCEKI